MLLLLSDSGWAQVATTKDCSSLSSNHGGNHFSWQSQRKLSLLMWLQRNKTNTVRCEFCMGRGLQRSQPFHVSHIPPFPSAGVEGRKGQPCSPRGTNEATYVTHLSGISTPHRTTQSCIPVTLPAALLFSFQSGPQQHLLAS